MGGDVGGEGFAGRFGKGGQGAKRLGRGRGGVGVVREQAVADEPHQAGVIAPQGGDQTACHVDGVVTDPRVRAAQLRSEQSRSVLGPRAQGRVESRQQRGDGGMDAPVPFEIGEGGRNVPRDVRVGLGLTRTRTGRIPVPLLVLLAPGLGGDLAEQFDRGRHRLVVDGIGSAAGPVDERRQTGVRIGGVVVGQRIQPRPRRRSGCGQTDRQVGHRPHHQSSLSRPALFDEAVPQEPCRPSGVVQEEPETLDRRPAHPRVGVTGVGDEGVGVLAHQVAVSG